MNITIGPSMVENRALRITARWSAGYPIPWTNISWTARSQDGQLWVNYLQLCVHTCLQIKPCPQRLRTPYYSILYSIVSAH